MEEQVTESNTELRSRILAALTAEGPDVLRIVNVGTLEEELWTEDDWRDEYADVLEAELGRMVADGLLQRGNLWGEVTFHLAPPDTKEVAHA